MQAKKHLTALQIANRLAASELSSLANVVKKAASGAIIVERQDNRQVIVNRAGRETAKGSSAVESTVFGGRHAPRRKSKS
jgi:hypothetical protein